jgi:hypothetical protein
LFDQAEAPLSQRVWNHTHPDVKWVAEDEGKNTIGIESVRAISQWAAMKPFESAWKICIVLAAEKITEVAANAFLKTLEEPPKNTVFCCLWRIGTICLETIQSRSFEIRLMPMAVQSIPLGAGSLEALPVREIFRNFPGTDAAGRGETEARRIDAGVPREDLSLVSETETDPGEVNRWIEAMDLLYDSKSALDLSSNQKLTATRLAMRLARLFPSQKVVSL